VQATIKAIIDTTDGVRLQVSFGEQTARIYFVGSDALNRPK